MLSALEIDCYARAIQCMIGWFPRPGPSSISEVNDLFLRKIEIRRTAHLQKDSDDDLVGVPFHGWFGGSPDLLYSPKYQKIW